MKNEKTIAYSIRVPETLKLRLEKQAKAEKRSLNKQMIVMLENALKLPKADRSPVGV